MATDLGSEVEESGDVDGGSPFLTAEERGRRRTRSTSAVTSGLQDC